MYRNHNDIHKGLKICYGNKRNPELSQSKEHYINALCMANLCRKGKIALAYHWKWCKNTSTGSSQYAIWQFYMQEDLVRLVDDNPFLKCLHNFYLEIFSLKKWLTNINSFLWFLPRMHKTVCQFMLRTDFFNSLWSYISIISTLYLSNFLF